MVRRHPRPRHGRHRGAPAVRRAGREGRRRDPRTGRGAGGPVRALRRRQRADRRRVPSPRSSGPGGGGRLHRGPVPLRPPARPGPGAAEPDLRPGPAAERPRLLHLAALHGGGGRRPRRSPDEVHDRQHARRLQGRRGLLHRGAGRGRGGRRAAEGPGDLGDRQPGPGDRLPRGAVPRVADARGTLGAGGAGRGRPLLPQVPGAGTRRDHHPHASGGPGRPGGGARPASGVGRRVLVVPRGERTGRRTELPAGRRTGRGTAGPPSGGARERRRATPTDRPSVPTHRTATPTDRRAGATHRAATPPDRPAAPTRRTRPPTPVRRPAWAASWPSPSASCCPSPAPR
ncbi:hypothetical protein GA0115253_109373 [Streptomyces sp. Termitarium-T10T-6]|nr:hypothetical protein GA0115253_109373 [Streptomyces sp. Termitarium-T10T-6]